MSSTRLNEEYETKSVTIRGTTYQLKELSAADYESIVKLAAGPEGEAELNTVLRLMTVKALIEPKLTSAELEAKTYPVYSKLLTTVNNMHFTPLVSDEEEKEAKAANKNGKGGETPNA